MTEQLATKVQNVVSYTEIPDGVLAERIDSAQNSLSYLSGERRQKVMHSLAHLIFEQEARSTTRHSADQWAETRLAVQEYDMHYGSGDAVRGGFVPPELEVSGGAVASS